MSGATPLPSASTAIHHKGKAATTHRASGQPAAPVTTNCPAGSGSGNVSSGTGTLRTGGSPPCAITKPSVAHRPGSSTTALEKYRKLRQEAGATDPQGTNTTGSTTGSGGNQGTGSGSGSGTGGNRGGNQGTGSGSGSGTGGNRGGNQGTGSGSGSGTGGNRGGNQGTGSGKGGTGTGTGKGGTGKKGTGTGTGKGGTGKKGTGTGTGKGGTGKKGTGTGQGATGGSRKHHRHNGTEAKQGTNSSGQAGTIEDGAPTG